MGRPSLRIALMWRGDWRAPETVTRYQERLQPIIAALTDLGATPEPIAFFEEEIGAIRERLLRCDGAMVWINPIADGRNRSAVDALLREAATAGTWISAHPDVIDRMATKDVLYTTQTLGWGSNVERYESLADLEARFPEKLASGPRVLKPRRGNDGRGVLKVARLGGDMLSVQHASDERVETMNPAQLFASVAPAFVHGGVVIDQEFHAPLHGMTRCYMSLDRVVGFGEQAPRTEVRAFAMQPSKAMHPAGAPAFSELREMMEQEWTPGLQRLLNIKRDALPVLWDADFLTRARGSGPVLCEINASCVSPFPEWAPAAIARNAVRLAGERKR